MPTARKPADRRQRRNKAAIIGLPSKKVAAPAPPKGLLVETSNDWATYWDSPLAAEVVETDLPALRRLFQLRDQRTRAHRACTKRPFIEGSQGQFVVNPMMRQLSQMDSAINQLEDRFALSPKARGLVNAQAGRPLQRTLDELNAELDAGDDRPDPRHDRDAQ